MSSRRHCWTAMWWTTSMPLTCHCTLKRESVHYKFSTVEQLPWQLEGLISMLQRLRGESLIISAWQRGPTDRAKAKHQVFVLHLRTTAPYLQLLCPVMCQTEWGWEEWSQSVLLSFFIFSLSNHHPKIFLSLIVFLSNLFSPYYHPHCVSILTVSTIYF